MTTYSGVTSAEVSVDGKADEKSDRSGKWEQMARPRGDPGGI